MDVSDYKLIISICFVTPFVELSLLEFMNVLYDLPPIFRSNLRAMWPHPALSMRDNMEDMTVIHSFVGIG